MNIIRKFYKHVVIFISLLILLNYGVNYFFDNQKERYLAVQTELLDTKFKTQYKYFKIMSHDIYTMYKDNKKLMNLFSRAYDSNTSQRADIRQEMYSMLKKRYKRLTNMGIRQVHFHLPDNRSFLRMHEREKFGDDLSSVRESVVFTNSMKKPSEGLEVGKVTHSFRFVYPLFDRDKKHMGSMEVSFSSRLLLELITDEYVVDKHFLILKSEIDKNLWNDAIQENYETSLENREYLVEKDRESKKYDTKISQIMKDKDLVQILAQKMLKGATFSASGEYNYNSIALTLLPVKNTKQNKDIAYIVMYAESDFLDALTLERNYTKMLAMSMLTLLFLFSIYVTITQQKLREMAHFDKLTQLPNRAYFYIELEQEIKRAKRLKEKLSVMFVDLDGFKITNDTYGHNVGDELLIRVARRLENSIRNVDIVGRIGGDEFTVLLTGVKENDDCGFVAEKIIASINEDFVINQNNINIGASIGIANFPEHGEDLEALINNADNAMYRAKKGGKNRFVIHELKK